MTALRALSPTETAVLDALLAQDVEGVTALRLQARDLLARRGCSCGCGTIDLVPQDPDAPRSAAHPVPVEATVLNDLGEPVGGVLVLVQEGLLTSLEVYGFDDEPLAMPQPTHLVRYRTQQPDPPAPSGTGGPG